jgi:hypothetical protein
MPNDNTCSCWYQAWDNLGECWMEEADKKKKKKIETYSKQSMKFYHASFE